MLLLNKNEILGYIICFIPLFSIFDNSIVLQAVFCFSCGPLFCTHSFIWITNKSHSTKRLAPIYTLLDSFFFYSTLISVQLNKFHDVFFSVGISHVCRFFEKYLSIVKLRSNLIGISIFFLLHLTLRKKEKNQQRKVGSSHWTCVYMLVFLLREKWWTWKKQQTQCVFNNILLRFNNKKKTTKKKLYPLFIDKTKNYVVFFFRSCCHFLWVFLYFFRLFRIEILVVWRILLCHVGCLKHYEFSVFLLVIIFGLTFISVSVSVTVFVSIFVLLCSYLIRQIFVYDHRHKHAGHVN